MSRWLIVGLSLLLVGCASAPNQARYNALQHPAYPGNANKDLVPYQARDRDGTACVRSDAVQAKMDAAVVPGRSLRESVNDPATWDAFFACMATRGWVERPR